MAHLPEPIEEPPRRIVAPRPARALEPEPLDELEQPAVEHELAPAQPKQLAPMAETPLYPRHVVTRVGALAGGLGATLGAMGLLVSLAVQRLHLTRSALAAHSSRSLAQRADAATGQPVFSFETPDGGGDGAAPYVPSAVPPSPLAAQTPEGWVATQQRLGRGRTLPQALRALGVSPTLTAKVISSMRTLLNMRALQPGDVVVAQRDPTRGNELRRVEYRRGESEVISVTIAPDQQCSAERIRVVKSTVRVAAGFIVRGSLQETLRAAHLQPEIIPLLQQVFRELDLGTTLNEGDSVRLIVDEERVNESYWRYARITAIELRTATGRSKRGYWMQIGGRGDYFDAAGTANVPGVLQAPINPPRITSPFNPHRMHPVLHRVMPHEGTDFGAPTGTPVTAAADGVVTFRGWGGPTGNLVRIQHSQLGLETGYAHLVRFEPSVGLGARVRVGQVIGYVGSTGRSTGPHLHWSVKRNGQFIDGAPLLAWRRSVPAASRPQFDAVVAQLNAELDAVRLDGAAQSGTPATASPQTP